MDASLQGSDSLLNGNVTVTTTASTPTIDRKDFNQRSIMLFNNSTTITVYIGTSTVSSTNGFPLPPGDELTLSTRSPLYLVSGSSTADVRWLVEAA